MPEAEIECAKCGSICIVDGDFPKHFAYCGECNDYAEGFDCLAYAQDVMADIADSRPHRRGARRLNHAHH